MRILLVSSGSGSRGGGEIFLDYLGRGLSVRGHEVLTWIPNHPRMNELAAKCAVHSRVIRSDYKNTYDYVTRSLSTYLTKGTSRRVAREWERYDADIIHINKQNLEDGLDLLRAARLSKHPSVCTVHLTQTGSYLGARHGWLRDRVARGELQKYGGTFVAVQSLAEQELATFIGRNAVVSTVLNGVPTRDIVNREAMRKAKRQELGLSPRDVLILGVGRLAAQKRPFLFLDIVERLSTRLPHARFVWVGDGMLRAEWERTVVRKRLNSISCVGWKDDVLPWLLAGDLLLHTAQFEGLPLAVLEAMDAHLPCAVTTDLAAQIPIFDETNVLFVDDLGPLATTLEHPEVLHSIATAAKELVVTQLSIDRMAASYEGIYTSARDNCRRT